MRDEGGNTTNMDMLLDALPKDSTTDPTGTRLARLIATISEKKMPVSSFSRTWILGSLHAQVTLGYIAYWLRSRFAGADDKQRLKNEAHLSAALKLLATMGYLRGAVMKVGQLLANLPEVVPAQFAEVLSVLHFEAPPMHYAMVREVFLDEFGREPEEVFASFDRQAFAAASLGQVHRALLKTGEEVAVKIQYPGIANTIKADLRNLRILLQPLCLSKDWQNTLDKLADFEQMLLIETDYRQEARFSCEIRKLFTPQDQVVVPLVYEEYSTGRVLTTEFIKGRHLDDFLDGNPSQELRDHFTHLLTVATMRPFYSLQLFNADSHPGNFIFMDDGRLGLIDFGCTRVMSDVEWQIQQDLEKGGLTRDTGLMNHAIARACLYNNAEEIGAERLETVGRAVLWNMEPWLTEGLFDFGDRDFFLRGINTLMQMSRKRYTRGLPLYLWTNRFVFGARAIAYRLQGRCDFRKIFQEELAAGKPHRLSYIKSSARAGKD